MGIRQYFLGNYRRHYLLIYPVWEYSEVRRKLLQQETSYQAQYCKSSDTALFWENSESV